jgi:hypothetical protein
MFPVEIISEKKLDLRNIDLKIFRLVICEVGNFLVFEFRVFGA